MLAVTKFLRLKQLTVTTNTLKFYSTTRFYSIQEKINLIQNLSAGNSISKIQQLYYGERSYNSVYNKVKNLKDKIKSLDLSKESINLIKDQIEADLSETAYNNNLKHKLNHILYNEYLLILNYLKFNPNNELNWIDASLNSISENRTSNINNAFENVQMKQGRWSSEEISLFNLGLSQYPNDFASISKLVGTRTTKQCYTRYLSYSKSDPNNIRWSIEEDEKLMELYKEHGFHICRYIHLLPVKRPYPGILRRLKRLTVPGVYIDHKQLKSHLQDLVTKYDSNWDLIGRHFPNINSNLLQGFWEFNWNLNNKKISFSPEEDKELIEYVEKCGRNWKKIGGLLGLRTDTSYMFRYQLLNKIK